VPTSANVSLVGRCPIFFSWADINFTFTDDQSVVSVEFDCLNCVFGSQAIQLGPEDHECHDCLRSLIARPFSDVLSSELVCPGTEVSGESELVAGSEVLIVVDEVVNFVSVPFGEEYCRPLVSAIMVSAIAFGRYSFALKEGVLLVRAVLHSVVILLRHESFRFISAALFSIFSEAGCVCGYRSS
jgi:hypothetical protein